MSFVNGRPGRSRDVLSTPEATGGGSNHGIEPYAALCSEFRRVGAVAHLLHNPETSQFESWNMDAAAIARSVSEYVIVSIKNWRGPMFKAYSATSILVTVCLAASAIAPRSASADSDTASAQVQSLRDKIAFLEKENAALRAGKVPNHERTKSKVDGLESPGNAPGNKIRNAFAADLPVQYAKAPALPDRATSWTGFYAGVNGGYGWGNARTTATPNDQDLAAAVVPPAPNGFDLVGAVGGVQAGYNWQFNRKYVFGIEADIDYSDIKGNGSATSSATVGPFTLPFTSRSNEQVRWFGTARARVGFLATDSLLIYGTGGLAYGRVEQSANYANNSIANFVGNAGSLCPSFTTCYTGSSSRFAAGWTAGGGLEYALQNNWTIRAEYLFVNLGSNSFNETVPPGAGLSSMNVRFNDTTFNLVRGGVNYRF